MAKSTNAAEFNTFVGGLITEASPLTFPENASLDEANFVLNRDGSRQRRLGMNYEQNLLMIDSNTTLPSNGKLAVTSVNWENAGGEVGRWVSVVQVGNVVKFFKADASSLSNGLFFSYTFPNVAPDKKFSYAIADSLLVIATGERSIYVFEYDNGNINITTKTLLVRDLFGVEDLFNGADLRQGSDVATRPTALTSQHLYNLRNQTWGVPRLGWYLADGVDDCISRFFAKAKAYPSNADSVNHALSKRADADPSTTDRFRADDIFYNPIGTMSAAKGFFIIDAMARGTSRLNETIKLKARYPELKFDVTSLPIDETPGGPSVICEYAGRVWYAGFDGTLIDGDAQSPRMASYVLFSQLVDSPADIVSCYQEGDPTSTEEPELVDTDGGFIRIEGAYGICRLVNVGAAIMVVAANGIWMIQGGSDYGFTATNYLVTKLSEHGSSSPNSVVVVDNTFMYWGEDGIYHLTRNQYGDYVANNLTEKTIQKYYEAIASNAIEDASGSYDSYDKKVKWIFNTIIGENDSTTTELVFDLALAAFYPAVIKGISPTRMPMPVGSVKLPPYKLSLETQNVTVQGVNVTASGSQVTVTGQVSVPTIRETKYIILASITPSIQYTFGNYYDETFTDWVSYDLVGIDAEAYMVTGYLAGQDYQREKDCPYITFHLKKTETGFEDDGTGDWKPVNPSSCLVQSQWAWTNNAISGKWGRTFQAYRHRRQFFPTSIGDPYNDGYSVVETKNKLRGNGKVLSLLIKTEPKKDLHLYGWSMVVNTNGTV